MLAASKEAHVPASPGTASTSLKKLSVGHLLGIAELTRDDITSVFATALHFRENHLRAARPSTILAGRTIVNFFAESSTRTRSSFQLAERHLGAEVLNFQAESSSFGKGETLLDTVRNIEAMHVDAIVIRHSIAGVPWFLADRCGAVIVNAGDGRHEHPTQALLDCLTLHEHWNGEFAGRRVAIVGDILHGRVALSNILALQMLGAEVAVCGPPTLIPRGIEALGVRVLATLDEAIEFADALNMLRIQRERQDRSLFPSVSEYSRYFGLNRRRMEAVKKPMLILHPGPINRGIELDAETADGARSVILEQVENGVAVRMAVLAMLLGAV